MRQLLRRHVSIHGVTAAPALAHKTCAQTALKLLRALSKVVWHWYCRSEFVFEFHAASCGHVSCRYMLTLCNS
jgi:hypothetical protein